MPHAPIRTIRTDDIVGRIVLRCAQQSISVHSLHSAAANAPDGVTDWLAKSIAKGASRPVIPHPDNSEAGEGRLLECDEAMSLSAIIDRIKAVLSVRHLRVALGAVVDEHHFERAAESCFVNQLVVQVGERPHFLHHVLQHAGAAHAGIFLTSEMTHARVLAANARGLIVILTGQSTVEHAFMRQLRQDMQDELLNSEWAVKVKCAETSHGLIVV